MDLASYLLKPVQRMGKYALLLQQLVKACNSVEVSEISNFFRAFKYKANLRDDSLHHEYEYDAKQT